MKWHTFLKKKYTKLFHYALLFDEFFYLVTHQRLIRFQADRSILHGTGPENEELCKEFNVNKFSYLFDGEFRFLKDFLYNLAKHKTLFA